VKAEDFAKPHVKGDGAAAFLDSLPNILGAADLRAVARAIVEARQSGGGIIWGFGAHVLKTGLSPILVDLAARGFVSAFATNGAGIIHDFEIALSGSTSRTSTRLSAPGGSGWPTKPGGCSTPHHGRRREGPGLGQSVAAYLAGAKPRSRTPASPAGARGLASR